MPAPDLPVLSAQQPIAATLRPTSAFLLFMEKTRKAIIAAFTAQDAIDDRQDAADAALQEQIDLINRILAGEEPFSGLNVGGTDVKPFLDKTDGSAITDGAALDDGLVSTGKIAASAVTGASAVTVDGPVSVRFTTPVLLAEYEVTVEDGDVVDLIGVCQLAGTGGGDPADKGDLAAIALMTLDRDGTTLGVLRSVHVFHKGMNSSATITLAYLDSPGAGTYTYGFYGYVSDTTYLASAASSNVYLRPLVLKR